MKTPAVLLLFFASLFITGFLSCSPDIGLFYSVTMEEESSAGALPPTISPGDLVENASGEMLLVSGGLYLYTADAWKSDVVSPAAVDPQLPADSLARSAAYAYGTFFVCFVDNESGYPAGLYSSADPFAETSAWTKTTGVTNPERLLAENGVLFVVSRDITNATWSIYSYDGSVFTEELPDLDVNAGVWDMAWDGTDYWILWGESLYRGTLGGVKTVVDCSSIDGANIDYTGLFFHDPTGTIYLAANSLSKGSVWSWNGTGWTSVGSELEKLNDFAFFTVNGTPVILVGSVEGYYEFDGVSTFTLPEITCVYATYKTLELSDSVIREFMVSGDTFYALTSNAGLWKNSVPVGGSTRSWIQQ
ncbi:MAG: hypothetical protein JW760_08725 [Spirochaetales bacterium]|nr:hypothetical protein [Spirochaetales bacterium]